MPEITDIRVGPRGSRRRRVYVDGDEWRSVPAEVIRDIGLAVGQDVDRDILGERITKSETTQAWGRVLKLLDYRDRGSDELADRLVADGYAPEPAATAVSRAVEFGFVDDRRFAEGLVRHLVDGKRLGRRRVAAQLSAKGVSEDLSAELLERCCSPEHEAERASSWASSLARRCGGESDRVAKRLVTKGFDTGVALRAARQVCAASDVPFDEE